MNKSQCLLLVPTAVIRIPEADDVTPWETASDPQLPLEVASDETLWETANDPRLPLEEALDLLPHLVQLEGVLDRTAPLINVRGPEAHNDLPVRPEDSSQLLPVDVVSSPILNRPEEGAPPGGTVPQAIRAARIGRVRELTRGKLDIILCMKHN